jgi:hypothetical protein
MFGIAMNICIGRVTAYIFDNCNWQLRGHIKPCHPFLVNANKKDKPENIRSANVADEILNVLNKFNGSPLFTKS